MGTNGGLLVAAVVILAIATGCKRDDQRGEAAHESVPRPLAGGPNAVVTAVQTPQAPAKAPPKAPTTAPAAPPSIGQARSELDELADNALKLRHALLHADFRGVDDDDAKPKTSEKSKETENDSR